MQTIPITLSHSAVPVGIKAANFDELMTLICQYVAGQISSDVDFYVKGTVDPTANVGLIFLNTSEGSFKMWDNTAGKYIAITSTHQQGEIRNTFVNGDDPQHGWIVLDGRKISSIGGITQQQSSVLQQLFGLDGTLPSVTPLATLSGMPSNGTFGQLALDDTQPPAGQITALPFGTTYDPGQPQALAANTETLRTSVDNVKDALNEALTNLDAMVQSLNGGGPAIYAQVFVGYP